MRPHPALTAIAGAMLLPLAVPCLLIRKARMKGRGVKSRRARSRRQRFVSRKKKAKPWSNVSIVTLQVRDLAASRRFCADGLDGKPLVENKEIVFFQTGGMIFTLFLRDELAQDENRIYASVYHDEERFQCRTKSISLKRVYDRFNARDMETVFAAMHEDVIWGKWQGRRPRWGGFVGREFRNQ
jgi:hypothetical protein